MGPTEFLDFDLVIEARDGGYIARVVQSPAGESRVEFVPPFTDLELENFVLHVGQTRRGVRYVGSPQWDAVLAFGTRLFDTVFAEGVGTAFQVSFNKALGERKGLRLRLRLSAVPELASIPWEYLYSDALGSFVTLLTDTPLVRFVDLPHAVEALSVGSHLSILAVVSNPTDIAELDVAQEQERLRQALAVPIEEGRVKLQFLDGARLATLREALSEDEVHVLHFIGHGGFDGKEGVLVFENEAGTSRKVTAATLAMLLQNYDTLRLVVLNACEGARNSAHDPFAGVAQALVRGRIPAVIAMQFEITDRAAIAFCHEFYKAVARGQPVDAACARGRLALLGEGNDVEWGTPVLYLRAPNGQVFDIAADVKPDPNRLLEQAISAQDAGELDKAIALLVSAVELDPELAGAADRLADLRAERDQQIRRRDVGRLLAVARSALDSGNRAEATAAVGRILQMEPGHDEARRLNRRLRFGRPVSVIGAVAAAAVLAVAAFLVFGPDPGPGPTGSTAGVETTVPSPTSVPPDTADSAAPGIFRTPAPLNIDGDDGDWTSLSGEAISSDVLHCGTAAWSGPDDYEATWRLAWDDEGLYLLVVVTDDVRMRNPASTGDIRMGDTITVSLGTGPGPWDQELFEDGLATCQEGTRENPGPGEPGVPSELDFHAALIPDGDEVAVWFAQGNGQGPFEDAIPSPIRTAATELGGGGFQLEAVVPWEAIGLDGPPRQLAVRLEGRDEDDDADGRDTFVSNAPGSVTNNTLTWVTLPLQDN